ncbi:copper chaperone PCu(A)C [Azospirillum sp. 11R-A]|uniref:copper chaperone PCu(A)C n=1 Tax=Azospirillum sp. 11R-A TaxID=3111634 RepID=UPI003C2A9D70
MKTILMAGTIILSLTGLAGAAPVSVGDLSVERAWARATIPSAKTGAVYFTIRNTGARPDRILALETTVAGHAMPHQTMQEGDVSRMVEENSLSVPAAGVLELKPGGTHIMLMDLKGGLNPGQSFILSVTFEQAGTVSVPVTVGRAGAMGPE